MQPSKTSPPADLWQGHDPPIDPRRPVNHRAALETTRTLCRSFARMYPEVGLMIDPLDVLEVLNQAGVRFVLMGAHGIGGWMHQARATRDVDVVVRKSDHKKAVKAIGQRFPELVIDDQVVVTRFLDPASGEPVVDLMRPVNLYQHVFENAVPAGGGHVVPNVEMAIASKFSALVSRNRPEEKQYLDASDLIQMVKRNHERLDRNRLRQLGEAVYPEGGENLLKMVDDVLAGRRLRI
ncbi:MAG TPA: hypothetical protein PK867_04115 [Pirellulales bacterium]|nr:hypothetical protein [Pirellulales bacterium]